MLECLLDQLKMTSLFKYSRLKSCPEDRFGCLVEAMMLKDTFSRFTVFKL